MAEQQPFVTGTDPLGNLYQMPQDYIREAVFAPGGDEEQASPGEGGAPEARQAGGGGEKTGK
ncbi:MAG: hypothetical protein ACOZEN_15375 [Thermodesulfobacteriota bacterium]